MTIYAPISGRVLTLDAQPGKRLVGMDPASEQNSSTVISMYDPKSLQVRVDVRLEDVPHVQIGQPVEIQTAALAKPLAGEVLWVTTRADIQKNTLQVKVSITDPPQVITPEMLAQVTFLAPPQPEETASCRRAAAATARAAPAGCGCRKRRIRMGCRHRGGHRPSTASSIRASWHRPARGSRTRTRPDLQAHRGRP